MSTLTKILTYPLLVAAALAATSCHHKDLCYMHPHTTRLQVVYDWSRAPEASPAGMCAYFYSRDTQGAYERFDFPGAKGGEIELAAGGYQLITYNNDTEAVQFSSTNDFSGHVAFTRQGDILEPMYGNGVTSSLTSSDGERVVITPDALYGCSSTGIEVSAYGVDYTITHNHGSRGGDAEVTADSAGNQTITLYPHDMLCHYSFEVRHVKNVGHVSRVSAALSGMAGMMNLSTEELDRECVTLPVGARPNPADSTITGAFLTFGHNADNTQPHKMSFYVVMDDGSKYSFKDQPNLDVTDQVDNAPDRRHVHIIIDGLDLPQTISGGSGYNPAVEDWGVVEEDLNL